MTSKVKSESKQRILVVEDDFATAKLIQNRLIELGYKVTSIVATGIDAIREVEQGQPDLVLMDIELRGEMDGIETAEQVRSQFNTPIVFITAHEDEAVLQRAKGTAPLGYIIKPFKDRELRSAIEVALELNKLEKKLRQSEEHYRQLVELSPDAIIVVRNGELVFANNATARLIGADSPEELFGKQLVKFIHPDYHKVARKQIKGTEKDNVQSPMVEEKFIRLDETEVVVEVTAMPFTFKDRFATQVIARDITERRKAEDALKQAHEYAKDLIDSSLDMIIAVDNDRKITEFNKAAEKTFGYRQKDVLGKSVNILYANPEEGHSIHKTTLKNGRCVKEIWNMRKTGDNFPALLSASVLRDSQGEVIGVMGISREITEQKQIQDELQERQKELEKAHNRLSAIIENTPEVAIQGYDKTGTIIFWNRASEDLYGVKQREAMGKHLGGLILSENDGREFEKLVTEVITNKKPAEIREWSATTSLGEIRHVMSSLFPIISHDGDDEVVCMDVDITQRIEAEEALRESEKKFRTLFEDSQDAIYLSTTKGRFLDVNKAAVKLFGYTKEELLKLDIRKVYVDPKDRIKFQKEIEQNGFVHDYELRLKKRDGTAMNCLETATIRKGPDGSIVGYQGIFRDITERLQAQHELENALKQAQKADKVKSLFLANMSHEIRTPLNSILGFTELIEESVGHLVSPEKQTFFDTIRSSGERLLHTVHEILDMSQIEADTLTTDLQELNLVRLVNETISPLLPQAERKGLKLAFATHISNGTIKADEYCFVQALTNIVENAIKYTNEGRINISLTEKDGQLILSIKDTGIGISPEYLDEIFDVFTQESTGYTKKFQGVGLGLALTKRYLGLCDATIDVASKKGVGSTFTLTFQKTRKTPIKKVRKPKTRAPIVPIPEAEKKPLVLVVEDDLNSQKLISFYLKQQYDSFFAVSVEEAKEKLKSESVAAILLDLSLIGEEDGLDLVRYLRKTKKWKDLPIIVTTAHTFETDKENCLEAGCNDYVAKPLKQKDLLERIEKWI